jgi:hypothetical protein
MLELRRLRETHPMRRALIVLSALALDAAWLGPAHATQVCAWIAESIEEGDTHKFELWLSVDAPASASVRVQGPSFTSGAMGGELIELTPAEAKNVDGEGFDVDPGDDLAFDVRLYDHALTLDELDAPTGPPLAAFTFHRKVGEGERTPPPALAAKQCKPLA